jgi:hypothetical protein
VGGFDDAKLPISVNDIDIRPRTNARGPHYLDAFSWNSTI